MPSHRHEVLVELFHRHPELAPELLATVFGLDLPAYQRAEVRPGGLTDVYPTEYRADAVVALADRAGTPLLAVIVEVQLGRDPGKRRSWPAYLATLYARLGCPTVLLVMSPDPAVAKWCAGPIDLGHPEWILRPVVLGWDRVPVLTDPEEATRSPELAVLSALAHGVRDGHEKVLDTLLAGLAAVDRDHANLYADIVLAALPEAARSYLETLMITQKYEYQSDFARRYFGQGKAEGKAEGEAKAVLAVLATRGIEVPDDARARITSCTDLDQLETWVRRAVTAHCVHDLFVEP
jgi:hypothetical protein